MLLLITYVLKPRFHHQIHPPPLPRPKKSAPKNHILFFTNDTNRILITIAIFELRINRDDGRPSPIKSPDKTSPLLRTMVFIHIHQQSRSSASYIGKSQQPPGELHAPFIPCQCQTISQTIYRRSLIWLRGSEPYLTILIFRSSPNAILSTVPSSLYSYLHRCLYYLGPWMQIRLSVRKSVHFATILNAFFSVLQFTFWWTEKRSK
jgi:hypothetical protein